MQPAPTDNPVTGAFAAAAHAENLNTNHAGSVPLQNAMQIPAYTGGSLQLLQNLI